MTETTPSPLGDVIKIDDERIKNHLDRVGRLCFGGLANTDLDIDRVALTRRH